MLLNVFLFVDVTQGDGDESVYLDGSLIDYLRR